MDLVISPYIPRGYSGDELIKVNFVAVVHPHHPLHQLARDITPHDLNREPHVVVANSGSKGWIQTGYRKNKLKHK